MRNLLLTSFLFLGLNFYAQVGIKTTTPQAQLDITSTNSGILIPRVDLTSLLIELPVTNPQSGHLEESTMVYHKGTNGIEAGYYYWDGTKWQGIAKKEEKTKGLQYYVFAGSGATPNTERTTINNTLVTSGIWTGVLNDAAQNTIQSGDNFFILFTGTLEVERSGMYQVQSISDDGARVIVDNIPVLNRWVDQGTTTFNGASFFLAKGKHKFEFWYYENAGGDFMQFNWLQNTSGSVGVINANSFIIE
ncbi:PA14 domain-containing protein [Flavobacterium sp.]|uniref:PA14 domain-containing protein n=1 Tax=Flavobacterium sp. TaxID=239 RepID=UPI0040474F81